MPSAPAAAPEATSSTSVYGSGPGSSDSGAARVPEGEKSTLSPHDDDANDIETDFEMAAPHERFEDIFDLLPGVSPTKIIDPLLMAADNAVEEGWTAAVNSVRAVFKEVFMGGGKPSDIPAKPKAQHHGKTPPAR